MQPSPSQASRTFGARREFAAGSVGVDVVDVRDVEQAIERHGARYLRRVYRPDEVSACASPAPRVQARRLAARFAAKEAVFKVLQLAEWQPAWTDVEVRSEPLGGCAVTLHGQAALQAQECGIGELAVSISHEGDTAVAFVVTLSARPRKETLSACLR